MPLLLLLIIVAESGGGEGRQQHQQLRTIVVEDKQDVIEEEALSVAKLLDAAGLRMVVVDTESRFVARGLGERLAEAAGHGAYYRLPQAAGPSAGRSLKENIIAPLVVR